MADMTAEKLILLDVAHLCVNGHELSYSERNTAIWDAFRLGREYESYMHLGQAKPAAAEGPGAKA